MCAPIVYCVALVLDLLMGFIHSTGAENEFTAPIKCYSCFAPARNNLCADPVKAENDFLKGMNIIECDYGVCLKWTYYKNGTLHMHRTCSANVRGFRLIMSNRGCRKERNDNGYICMCGRSLCNTSSRMRGLPNILVIQLMCLRLIIGFTSKWSKRQQPGHTLA